MLQTPPIHTHTRSQHSLHTPHVHTASICMQHIPHLHIHTHTSAPSHAPPTSTRTLQDAYTDFYSLDSPDQCTTDLHPNPSSDPAALGFFSFLRVFHKTQPSSPWVLHLTHPPNASAQYRASQHSSLPPLGPFPTSSGIRKCLFLAYLSLPT